MTRRINDCYKNCGRRALYRMVAIVPALNKDGQERSHRIKQSCTACPKLEGLSEDEKIEIVGKWVEKRWGAPDFTKVQTKWVTIK